MTEGFSGRWSSRHKGWVTPNLRLTPMPAPLSSGSPLPALSGALGSASVLTPSSPPPTLPQQTSSPALPTTANQVSLSCPQTVIIVDLSFSHKAEVTWNEMTQKCGQRRETGRGPASSGLSPDLLTTASGSRAGLGRSAGGRVCLVLGCRASCKLPEWTQFGWEQSRLPVVLGGG